MSARRQAELLDAAADALDDQVDPFTPGFLSKHDVTFDECMDLAEWFALGARVVAWAIENPAKASAALKGANQQLQYEAFMRAMDRLRVPS
jgi:hypothetical protein